MWAPIIDYLKDAKPVKVAVVGSRTFNNYELLKENLDAIPNISMIISGGARGADSLGARYSKEKGIPLQVFFPDWDFYGKSAGYKRNVQIVEACDVLVAFWDGESKGTKHSIDIAQEKGKRTFIIKF
jgi:hypothetical protein